MKQVAILLFEDFETLDAFGPVEIFGRLTELYSVRFFSLEGGLIHNRHGVAIVTEPLSSITEPLHIFLLPGGIGTRKAIDNPALLESIKSAAKISEFVLTVCTGSALLARTGLLDNKQATANKRAMAWAMTNGENIRWNKKARWIVDGKYYTSSGVSAGMDMALGFLSDRHGIEFARSVASTIEYIWTEDSNNDRFQMDS